MSELRPVEPVVDEQPPLDEPIQTDSLLDSLRARRQAIAAEQTIDLFVPGYHGMLALRCGAITGQTQSRITERHTRSKAGDRDVSLNADLLIAACLDVVARADADDDWKSLGEYDGQGAVRIDERLVAILGLTPGARTARATLRALFALAPSPDLAITSLTSDYTEWAAAVNEDVDETFSGE